MKFAALFLCFSISFSDSALTAEKGKKPPPFRWTQDEVDLGIAHRSTSFENEVPESALSTEGREGLKFSLVSGSGPSWLKLSSSGRFSGTPGKKDSGSQTWKVLATSKHSSARVRFKIEIVNRAPIVSSTSNSWPEIEEDSKNTQTIAGWATDPDGDGLSYKIAEGPNWLRLEKNGRITFAPPLRSAGPWKAVLEVTDGQAATRFALSGKVTPKNFAPQFKKGLSIDCKEREEKQLSLASYASDPNESDTTRFELKSTAKSWFTLSDAGTLTLKPAFRDIGQTPIDFFVSDGKAKTLATVIVQVQRDPRPPVWNSSNLPKLRIQTREPFSLQAGKWASDLDGLKLTITKRSGPRWLNVSPEGLLSGTPLDSDEDETEIKLRANNDQASADLEIPLIVIKKNYPPVVNKPLSATLPERAVTRVEIADSGAITDKDREKLSYSYSPEVPWLKLKAEGYFEAFPSFAQIGKHSFKVLAKDREASVELPFAVTVVRNPREPVWAELPIASGKTRDVFSFPLSPHVKDLDGVAVNFTKVSGPEWAKVSKTGEVTGVPTDADKGRNKLTVRASNDAAFSDARLVIELEKKNYPPVVVAPFRATFPEREVSKIELARAKVVSDRDDDPLSFSYSPPVAWLKINDKGTLEASPQFSHIGTHSFQFTAKDAQSSVTFPATFTITRNPRPPVWQEIPVTQAKTREALRLALSPYVKDEDGVPLVFSKINGPPWIQVSKNGEITGMPSDEFRGRNKLVVRATNDAAFAEAKLVIELEKKNYPPTLVKPLSLTIKERERFELALSKQGLVQDPDKEELQFNIETLPDWLSLSAEGTLSALPLFAHIGTHRFTAKVRDKEAKVDLPLQLQVVRNPRAPVWSAQTEIPAFETRSAVQWSFSSLAKDLDGLPLKFEKLRGPAWTTVTEKGEIKGTPQDGDRGRNTIEVLAKNDLASAKTTLHLNLNKKNYPLKLVKPLELTAKERERLALSLLDTGTVVDPDKDALTFQCDALPAWMLLSKSGRLEINASFAQIGEHRFSITVKDSDASIELPLKLKVERNPRPPVWKSDSLKWTIKARETLEVDIARFANDLDGLPITFSKREGPEWIQVEPSGKLKLAPQDAHIGNTRTVLSVKNDLRSAEKMAYVEVLFKNHAPTWVASQFELAKVRAGEKFGAKVSTKAQDADPSDKLTYQKVSGPHWAVVAPNGIVFGRPSLSESGTHRVVVRATDPSREIAEAVTTIQVTAPIPKPALRTSNVRLPNAYLNELFTFNLHTILNDKEFRYKKLSGPDWLIIRDSGEVEGIPEKLGEFDFSLEVTNGRDSLKVPGKGKVVAQ
jgi:hypothetical protein